MKYINKATEPQEFTDWKLAKPNAVYNDLINPEKAILKDSLLKEQKNICCYCECRIYSGDSHVEHFKPKGMFKFPQLQLEYLNLHASCMKTPLANVDNRCGHKKENYFSVNLISPLETDCHTHFTYTLNGEIKSTNTKGQDTITILNLDSSLLRAQRNSLIDYFISDVNDEERTNEITNHLSGNNQNTGEFHTMIEYLHATKQL